MLARVIKSFRDKYTNRIVRKGREIEISEERAAEINAAPGAPFIEIPKARGSRNATARKPAKCDTELS